MTRDQFILTLDFDPYLITWYKYAGILDTVINVLYMQYLNDNPTLEIKSV